MKKSLLGLLLAVALVVPAFASNLELVPKIGWLFSPEFTVDKNGSKVSSSDQSTFAIGADLFYDFENNFFAGIGFMFGDNIKYDKNDDDKIGFSNLYATAKYKFLTNGSQDDPLYVYPFINLGVGLPGCEYDRPAGISVDISTGFYWAAGIGGEYKNIILELVYGCNYSTKKVTGYDSENFSCTAFRINAGYKFNL